jgi:hypothetical protein
LSFLAKYSRLVINRNLHLSEPGENIAELDKTGSEAGPVVGLALSQYYFGDMFRALLTYGYTALSQYHFGDMFRASLTYWHTALLP